MSLNLKSSIDKEEAQLLTKGIEIEMLKIREGKIKTKSLEEIKKKYEL